MKPSGCTATAAQRELTLGIEWRARVLFDKPAGGPDFIGQFSTLTGKFSAFSLTYSPCDEIPYDPVNNSLGNSVGTVNHVGVQYRGIKELADTAKAAGLEVKSLTQVMKPPPTSTTTASPTIRILMSMETASPIHQIKTSTETVSKTKTIPISMETARPTVLIRMPMVTAPLMPKMKPRAGRAKPQLL